MAPKQEFFPEWKVSSDDQKVSVAYCHSNMAKLCRFYICQSKKNGLWSWDLWKNDLSRLATGNCLHVYSVQIIKTIVKKLYGRVQTFDILNVKEEKQFNWEKLFHNTYIIAYMSYGVNLSSLSKFFYFRISLILMKHHFFFIFLVSYTLCSASI